MAFQCQSFKRGEDHIYYYRQRGCSSIQGSCGCIQVYDDTIPNKKALRGGLRACNNPRCKEGVVEDCYMLSIRVSMVSTCHSIHIHEGAYYCACAYKDACAIPTKWRLRHPETPVELSVSRSDSCGEFVCDKGASTIGYRAD